MSSKEEIGAAAKALADQLLDLARKEQAREEFNKLMLSAQDLLLMDDRLNAADRGPDEYPDTLAPLFEVVYTGTEQPNIGSGPVQILEGGEVAETFNPETDTAPEPVPLPEGGTELTAEELASVLPTEDPGV